MGFVATLELGHEAVALSVEALARLAQPLREVVVLRMYHDYSHQQIAVALGISSTASEVRLCRALKRLRADLLDARTPPLRRSA